MENIQIGAVLEEKQRVGNDNAINFLGVAEARVLSTPHMIGYMERACRNLVLPMLEPGDDSVGTDPAMACHCLPHRSIPVVERNRAGSRGWN
jgi:predicted thioesterase